MNSWRNINYSRQHVSEFALPRLSQGLRTVVCHCSNVPAVWLGHRAIRLALEPELELEVQTGLLSPRQGRMLTARRPRCPASNIWSTTICWGCQSPHAPHAPDLSKESPVGNQPISGLLKWFWSPFEKRCNTTELYYHLWDGIFSAILLQEEARFFSTILNPSLFFRIPFFLSPLSTFSQFFVPASTKSSLCSQYYESLQLKYKMLNILLVCHFFSCYRSCLQIFRSQNSLLNMFQ